MRIFLVAILFFSPLLSGCGEKKPEGEAKFWVVAGSNRGNSFTRSSLGGYDEQGSRVAKSTLPKYYINSLVLDNQGQTWLGQGWNDKHSSNLLFVLDRGKLVKKIPVGVEPTGGIVQFGQEIVAGCAEAGAGFSLWSVDINTFISREIASVEIEWQDFLILTALSASDDYLLAAAIHDNPSTPDSPQTTIWWYDRDYVLRGTLTLEANTAVWSIVPQAGGNFLFLNNSGFIDGSPDLLVFDPRLGVVVSELKGSGFPFLGKAFEDKTYILNRIWSSTRVDGQRSVTVVEGDTITTLPLPDNLGAEGIAVADGMVYLAVWGSGTSFPDGVYRLDPKTHHLEQFISHPDASLIIAVP